MQTKTSRLDRGTPTYMAPEILLFENQLQVEGNIEDLKRTILELFDKAATLVPTPGSVVPKLGASDGSFW